jgi:hypothetical protein
MNTAHRGGIANFLFPEHGRRHFCFARRARQQVLLNQGLRHFPTTRIGTEGTTVPNFPL